MTLIAAACQQALSQEKIIVVLRGNKPEALRWLALELYRLGFKAIECTTTIPDVFSLLKQLKEDIPANDLLLGLGTLLHPSDLEKALTAPVDFLASPVIEPQFIPRCQEADRLFLPGIATPNEAYAAQKLGASAVKFFPAEQMGGSTMVSTFKILFPNLSLIAFGGITPTRIDSYLKAGALAVGLGRLTLPATELIERCDSQALSDHFKSLGLLTQTPSSTWR